MNKKKIKKPAQKIWDYRRLNHKPEKSGFDFGFG